MTRSTLSHQAVVTTLTLVASACAHGSGTRLPSSTPIMVMASPAAATADARLPGDDAKWVTPVPIEHPAALRAIGNAASGVPLQHPGKATQGDHDVSAIVGPVAAAAGPTPPMASEPYDPWEKYNRRVYAFNVAIDRIVAKPLAKTYTRIVPATARNGVTNFFDNLNQPVNIVNALLQGKGKLAAQATGRFALNTTVGIGGIFDPATRVHIPNHREDLGQTLGVWGWKHSRYLELPLFGPSTVRDALGMVGNAPLSPLQYVGNANAVLTLRGLQLADLRTRLFPLDDMLIGATDEYALVRDSWWQRREYRIFEDSDAPHDDGEQPLPDYLREDDSGPVTPNDVKPKIPGN